LRDGGFADWNTLAQLYPPIAFDFHQPSTPKNALAVEVFHFPWRYGNVIGLTQNQKACGPLPHEFNMLQSLLVAKRAALVFVIKSAGDACMQCAFVLSDLVLPNA